VIDLKRLRDEPGYRAGIERKRVKPGLLDDVLELDRQTRAKRTSVEELRAQQKVISKQVGAAAPAERDGHRQEATEIKDRVKAGEDELATLDARVRELALRVPNPADPSVPDGGEDDGEVLRVVGDPPTTAPALDHAAFAEAMGFVETSHAAESSGSRFASLMGHAVLVELALVQWVTGRLVAEGFTPVVPPVLVRERTMEEAGFFPTDRNQVYDVDGGALFLVGTSEVPLSALHRREAGTHGKDTTGIFRVHQFDKIEMFSFTTPDQSDDEHERILAIEEGIIGGLGLPYRVVNIAAGDLGAAAARKYDIEVWLPSEGRYRELTSCSNYRDFSARRLETRVKTGSGSALVHTLNGTACAIGRTMVFLFEHCQGGDAFVVPEVLRSITGFDRIERPA